MNLENSLESKNMSTKAEAGLDYTGREFLMKREFAAPRELVFKLWTDPKHLAQWWGPKGFSNPVCEWDARPGAKIFVVMRAPGGLEHPMGGEFREVTPPERLVFTAGALDEGGKMLFEFLHTVTFTEKSGRTTLTLVSRVTRTTAEANKYIGGFEMGMGMSLDRLGEHLAAGTEPLVVERTFNAPVALVWKAMTTRADMKEWFFDLAEFKAEEGFTFGFAVEHKGFNYVHQCKVMEVIAEKRLAFTWRYEGYAGNSLVDIELYAEKNRTRVKLTHTGLETFPATPAFARTNFEGGWNSIIGEGLKQFVEKTKQPKNI
jgi:uncharacterized protein YndB with AHSA1/START domain